MMTTAKIGKYIYLVEFLYPRSWNWNSTSDDTTPWKAKARGDKSLQSLQKILRARSDAFLIELSSRAEKRTSYAMFVFIVYLSR